MDDDFIPTPDRKSVKFAKGALRRIRQRRVAEFARMVATGFARTCPICGYEGEFAPVGEPPRLDGLCPMCRSRERHRLFHLWLQRDGHLDHSMSVLHFNPEPALEAILRKRVEHYVTSGRPRGRADEGLDIQNMDLADDSYDLIVALQSLEYVDHRKALSECFRCLTLGGRLVTTAPLVETWPTTYENPAAVSPRDRLLHFGQRDHTRIFGRDLRDHMVAAGFGLHEFTASEPDVSKYALVRGETLYVLTKPASLAPKLPRAKTKTKKG